MMLTDEMLQLPQTHYCRAESQKALALAVQVKEGGVGDKKWREWKQMTIREPVIYVLAEFVR